MSQSERATSDASPEDATPDADRPGEIDQADRVVIVEALNDAWRVQAAHMEPLRFRSAAEAERSGQRVARTLARLGFNTRIETYDAQGALNGVDRYSGEDPGARPPPRRRLDS